MIKYDSLTLDNGLTTLCSAQRGSNLVAFNLIYGVGSRNEDPSRTGFVHLFEHLMFRGTSLIPDFDTPVRLACGENNAFTTSDYTSYYMTLPSVNLETAFWLESDRMMGLNITDTTLETEKRVVLEEYKQRYLSHPSGDHPLVLRSLAYDVHPYRWGAIGMTPDHIAQATLSDVSSFYSHFYHPSNAILSVSGDVLSCDVFELAERWFGDIPRSNFNASPSLPSEPTHTGARRLEKRRAIPSPIITISFIMDGRLSNGYYVCDLISDILAGGSSSRLVHNLVRDQRLFSSIDAHVSGEIDPGLFTITGHLSPSVSVADGEAAIWRELDALKIEAVADYELDKVKNKFESSTIFGELNIMNIALNLGYYTLLGDTSLINRELSLYRSISSSDVLSLSCSLFRRDSSITLLYLPL